MSKRVISLFLVIVILFSLAGCGLIRTPGIASSRNESSEVTSAQKEKEYVIEEAKEYLKEKYPDDEFTYVSAKSPVWGASYYEVIFYSQKYDNHEVTVYITKLNESNCVDRFSDIDYEISDSYFTCVFRDDAIQYFDKLLTNVGMSNYILDIDFVTTIASSENVKSHKDFHYNYINNKVSFTLYLFTEVDIDENEDKLETVLDLLNEETNKLWLEYVIVDNLSTVTKSKNSKELRRLVLESKEYIMYSTFYEKESHFRSN